MRFNRYAGIATAFLMVRSPCIAATDLNVNHINTDSTSASEKAVVTENNRAGIDQDGIVPDRKGPMNVLEEMFLELPLGSGASMGSGGRGWLARWMALGGEGEVTIETSSGNITYPHRPAAFPQHLPQSQRLPTSGLLMPFTSFPSPKAPLTASRPTLPAQACVPATWPPIRWSPPPRVDGPHRGEKGVKIALLERGGCDFATKVLAAQERGAGAVIVGDTAQEGENREIGRMRVGGLITMFSPEDTENIHIPSVFVSRAAYLDFIDMMGDTTEGAIWITISDGADENATLGNMLSFALLMPSCFLLATIAIHRVRVARQKEQDRAPAEVVLSLPERVWQPDIVWEKDDTPSPSPTRSEHLLGSPHKQSSTKSDTGSRRQSPSKSSGSNLSPSRLPIPSTPPSDKSDPFDSTPNASSGPSRPSQQRSRSDQTITGASALTVTKAKDKVHGNKRRYFSKDECAICMDEFHAGDIVRILPCGHVFHKEECDEWLMKWRKLCPTCRADVTLPPGMTPQGSIRMTPVDGLNTTPRPTDLEPGVAYPAEGAAEAGLGGQARLAGRRVFRWMDQTRSQLFGGRGRTTAASDGAMLDERTPLVRQGQGSASNAGVRGGGEGSI